MRAAPKLFLTALLASAAACRNDPPPDQNFAIDNDAAGPTDVEALPADESSTTPSNELLNGDDNAEVSDLNTTNSD